MRSGAILLLVLASTTMSRGQDSSGNRDQEFSPQAIDRLVEQKLKEAGAVPSPAADDSEFLRRVTLDLSGVIPTLEETEEFLSSSAPDKRQRRIDELLDGEAYGRHLATIWHELIAPPDTSSAKGGRDSFAPWLAQEFNRNRPWNELVRKLLSVEGKIVKTPESGFILANSPKGDPDPGLLADATSRLFWGIQLRCAECHDHPFAPWKQEDFWGTAAFFSRLRKGYTDGKNPAGFTLTEAPPDEPISQKFWTSPAPPSVHGPAILLPGTARKAPGTVVQGRFLGAEAPSWNDDGPFRERFAQWATSSEHPYFARNAVNRMWALLFGSGIIHPLDALGPGTQGSHPELLELLSKGFGRSGQDLKHLVRVVCNSKTYQRTSRGEPLAGAKPSFLGRMPVKIMRPEMLYDSLSVVLYPPHRKPGAAGRPAPIIPGPIPEVSREEFIAFFAVQQAREGGSVVNPGIPQILRLMNGPLLNRESPGLARFLGSGRSARDTVESLYLAAYSRRPTAEESRTMEEHLSGSEGREKGAAGVLWALLNSSEFVLNH